MDYVDDQEAMAGSGRVMPLALCEANPSGTEVSKRKSPQGWKTLPYIVGNELCSMVANIGLSYSLILYLIQEYHFEQVTAANVLNAVAASKCFAPLLGGYLADTYLGRFRTILIASCLDVVGMVLLVLSAAMPSLRPAACPANTHLSSLCQQASRGQLLFLYTAFIFMVLAAGGLRPCAFVFGADQFSHDNTPEAKRTIQSFFNLYFFVIYVAVVIAATVVVYLQQAVSWSWGYGVPAMAMVLSILIFIMGVNKYKYVPPQGSPLRSLARVLVAAFHKRSMELPTDASDLHGFGREGPMGSTLSHTAQFRFLDKAAVAQQGELSKDGEILQPWRLCRVQEVEELKAMIRILPIWVSGMFHAVAGAQSGTFVVVQARAMERRVGRVEVPAGSVGVVSVLALAVFLPVYEKVVARVARKTKKGGVTELQRIGAGYALGVAAMLAAGAVEGRRRVAARLAGLADTPWTPAPMQVWWLAPQLGLLGLSEALNGIGLTEFYYHEMPPAMRATAGSLAWCNAGVGILASSVVVSAVSHASRRAAHGAGDWLSDNINRAHLDYFYFLVAALLALNLLLFLACSHCYRSSSAAHRPLASAAAHPTAEIHLALSHAHPPTSLPSPSPP